MQFLAYSRCSGNICGRNEEGKKKEGKKKGGEKRINFERIFQNPRKQTLSPSAKLKMNFRGAVIVHF